MLDMLLLQAHVNLEFEVQGPAQQFAERVMQHTQRHLQNAWSAYERATEETPYRAKALTSCAGLTVADLIAQAVEGAGYDIARTARMASFGLLWHGVSVRFWSRCALEFVRTTGGLCIRCFWIGFANQFVLLWLQWCSVECNYMVPHADGLSCCRAICGMSSWTTVYQARLPVQAP